MLIMTSLMTFQKPVCFQNMNDLGGYQSVCFELAFWLATFCFSDKYIRIPILIFRFLPTDWYPFQAMIVKSPDGSAEVKTVLRWVHPWLSFYPTPYIFLFNNLILGPSPSIVASRSWLCIQSELDRVLCRSLDHRWPTVDWIWMLLFPPCRRPWAIPTWDVQWKWPMGRTFGLI